MRVKHVEKRGLLGAIGRVFGGVYCAVFDDILGMDDCDGGE